MNKHNIKYTFTLNESEIKSYTVMLDESMLNVRDFTPHDDNEWTDLTFYQCEHCTLEANNKNCPVAHNLEPIIELCSDIASYENIDVTIETHIRNYSITNTTAQRAISSLLGLVIATSPCPYTKFFRSMAYFHLPLANDEETLFRSASSYLLLQYFKKKNHNHDVDYELSGLNSIYRNMQLVNKGMAQRLRNTCISDSAVNAIVILDMFAKGIPYSIDEALEELEFLFN